MANSWTDRILIDPASAAPAGSAVARGSTALAPLALGPDSPLWQQAGDDPHLQQLARDLVVAQIRAQGRIIEALRDLLTTADLRTAATTTQRPARLLGRLLLPTGAPAPGLHVGIDAAHLTAAEAAAAAATTADDGSFMIPLPPRLRDTSVPLPGLVVAGANGSETLAAALHALPVTGVLAALPLTAALTPLPAVFLGKLAELASADIGRVGPAVGEVPTVALGEDEGAVQFEKDTSADRFPYSVLFRLSDPALSAPTVAFRVPGDLLDVAPNLPAVIDLPAYGPIDPLLFIAGVADKLQIDLLERIPISRPLSIDGFRDGLAQSPGQMFAGTPVAGSLAIGYVVQMAQRWTPLGLALGDLVYSLPLAPGEQQRVAVVERTASSTVVDAETLQTSEALTFSEHDDTSTEATFRSAFQESASGGSRMTTTADSSGEAAAGGIGLAWGPLVVGAGGTTSSGHSEEHGSTATWMQGTKTTTSAAAEATHAAVQRQASARRQSARTGMRLATASETDKVITKVITNHNRTRALTVQYWEVVRLFDVTTSVEGVSLVCFVPLDPVRFLPAGEQPTLVAAPADRAAVLHRYAQLLAHADVLTGVVPARYRQGLTLITDFASDPQAAVQGTADNTQDVLTPVLTGSFLPFEDVYVTVVSKTGLRTSPTLLTGSPAQLPSGKDAYASDTEMLADLRARRAGAAPTRLAGSVVLPRSIPRQDVAGFEISRRFRRLDYAFIGQQIRNLATAKGLLGITGDLTEAVAAAAAQGVTQRSYGPDELETLLGGPPVTAFTADAGDIVFAQTSFSGSPLALPRTAYPVSARVVPPLLGYTSLLEIEKTLQWCLRNTMTCSVRVFESLSEHERIVLLERYALPLPPGPDGNPQSVPLVSCVTNSVLGYFGNCMVMPFQIPFAATVATSTVGPNGHPIPGLSTADITDALARFHTDGFTPPSATIALATKGVLGEAVLGRSPSAEKIDLTRFWNWQDSPTESASDIGGVTIPQGSLTAGLAAPSNLTSLPPLINNFSTTGINPDSTLAAALNAAAAQQTGFNPADLTNAAGLGTAVGKTLDTAENARKDALAQATTLAAKAMDAAVELVAGKKAKDTAAAAKAPLPRLTVFFAVDKSIIEDAPAGTTATEQLAAITAWTAKAKAAEGSSITVHGFAASDDTPAGAAALATARATALKTRLETEGLTGITVTPGSQQVGTAGAPGQARRAEAAVTPKTAKPAVEPH